MKTYLTFLQLSKVLKVTEGMAELFGRREFKSGSPALNSNVELFLPLLGHA